MGFIILLTLTLTIILVSLSTLNQGQEIKSARLLDLVIRDYTFKSYTKNLNFKTGKLHKINLPSNLSGITVDTVRFRCGSLHRYGAKIKEFHLNDGVSVHPCSKRVMLVRQNLGPNWSSLYYHNFELSGYQLISPLLGLLAYNFNSSQLKIQSGKKPIVVDFTNATTANNTSSSSSSSSSGLGLIPLCARFDEDGKVTLSNQIRARVCVATRDGHFGLVVESPLLPLRRKVSKWKLAAGGAIGAVLGGFLLSLLAIAVFVKAKKKKKRMEELERMAYEEEALRVSMVGHVRALTASATRTLPTIEHHHQYST